MTTSNPNTYTASDGSVWHLSHDCPPIPTRAHDWSATAEDYDGAPMEYDGPPADDRHFTAATRDEVIAEVEGWVRENDERVYCEACDVIIADARDVARVGPRSGKWLCTACATAERATM